MKHNQEIEQMILIKMNKLGIDPEKYKINDQVYENFSFVLINPPYDFFLKPGDIAYILKPGYYMRKESKIMTELSNPKPTSLLDLYKSSNSINSHRSITRHHPNTFLSNLNKFKQVVFSPFKSSNHASNINDLNTSNTNPKDYFSNLKSTSNVQKITMKKEDNSTRNDVI